MKHTIVPALVWCLTLALFVACQTGGTVDRRYRSMKRVGAAGEPVTFEWTRADGEIVSRTLEEVVALLIEHNSDRLADAREQDPDYPTDAGLSQQAADEQYLTAKLLKDGDEKKKCLKRNVGPDTVPSGSSDCWDHDNDGFATLQYCIDGTWYDTGEGCVPPVGTGG